MEITGTEILTILAILIGPIAAVIVTRYVDKQRERDHRREDIFKTLMRTRRTPMYPEHVGALNLIELEYYDEPEVIARWKELLRHFAAVHTRRSDEEVDKDTEPDEARIRYERFGRRLQNERQSLLAKLLHSMAKSLNFKAEQLEIFEGGYTPQGWEDIELEQKAVRRFALDLAFGNKLLPVGVFDYRQESVENPEKLQSKDDTSNSLSEPN